MNVRQLRFGSWIAAGALATAAAAVVAAAILLPYDDAVTAGEASQSTLRPVPVRPAERVTLEDFEPFLTDGLRLPVPETAAPAPAEAVEPALPAPVQTPAVQLVGTVTESGNNYAVFQMSDGTVETKRIGESIDGAEIVEIREGIAVMRPPGGGQATTLRVPLPPS